MCEEEKEAISFFYIRTASNTSYISLSVFALLVGMNGVHHSAVVKDGAEDVLLNYLTAFWKSQESECHC